jgi:hypothetical protein
MAKKHRSGSATLFRSQENFANVEHTSATRPPPPPTRSPSSTRARNRVWLSPAEPTEPGKVRIFSVKIRQISGVSRFQTILKRIGTDSLLTLRHELLIYCKVDMKNIKKKQLKCKLKEAIIFLILYVYVNN